MAFSSLKLVGPLPPMAGTKGSQIKRQTKFTGVKRSLQVRSKGIQEQQQPYPTTLTTSRRDAMLYMTAASLSVTTLFSTYPAEAVDIPEIMQKLMDSFKMLLPNQKTEDKSSAEGTLIPPTPPSIENTPAKQEAPPAMQEAPPAPNPPKTAQSGL